MKLIRSSLLSLSFALCLLAAACAPEPRICTQIGCIGSTLALRFPGLPAGKYTVVVQAGGKTFKESCTASPAVTTDHGDTVSFRGGPCAVTFRTDATAVQVTLHDPDGKATTRDFTPNYEDFRPNGPHCEPVCKRAIVEFK